MNTSPQQLPSGMQTPLEWAESPESAPSGRGTSESAAPSGALALTPGSVSWAVWKHMHDEHKLTLVESEVTEIVRVVNAALDARLRWWITNAEGIAKERAELFEAGEAMRRAYAAHIGTEKSQRIEQWDRAAQPMRDHLTLLAGWSSPNTKMSNEPKNGERKYE